MSTPESQEKSKVLFCDDSKLVRLSAKKILSSRFDLILKEDGEQAWEALAEDSEIQVLFTDLGMPNLDGFGLIERLRQSKNEYLRNLPVIVVTGAAEDESIKHKIFELGATDFLTKPFDATSILARAEAHTQYRKIHRKLQSSSNMDPVVDVLNQPGFDKQLRKDISFVNRHAENFCLLSFELDNFENIYNTLGQKQSDDILRTVSSMLKDTFRQEDSIGRYGLAKFLVSMPMARADGVVQIGRGITSGIETLNLPDIIADKTLSASIGIASLIKGQQADTVSLIKCSQDALENAKAIGTGQVQLIKFDGLTSAKRRTDQELSIDEVLADIADGKIDYIKEATPRILLRLKPLLELLNKQKNG